MSEMKSNIPSEKNDKYGVVMMMIGSNKDGVVM